MFNVNRVKLKVNSRLRIHDNKKPSLLTCFIQTLRKLKYINDRMKNNQNYNMGYKIGNE